MENPKIVHSKCSNLELMKSIDGRYMKMKTNNLRDNLPHIESVFKSSNVERKNLIVFPSSIHMKHEINKNRLINSEIPSMERLIGISNLLKLDYNENSLGKQIKNLPQKKLSLKRFNQISRVLRASSQ